MYSIIFQDHINTIKRITGILGAVLCLLSFILNFVAHPIDSQVIFNLILLFLLFLVFILTVIYSNSWTRYIQVIIFFSMGIITLIFSDVYFLGDVIYVTAIFYLYIYRIIKKYDKKSFITLISLIMVLRIGLALFVNRETIILETLSAIFTISIIALIIFIFQNQLKWYTLQSYKNEKMNRLGMNAANLIHEQNLDHITSYLLEVKNHISEGDLESAENLLETTADMIDDHNNLRKIFLESYNADDGLVNSVFNLNAEISSLAHFEYLNHIPEFYLELLEDYCEEPLYIMANRYEITGIFQNIINNAVEAMKKKTDIKAHKLILKTRKDNRQAVITISDTGIGFHNVDGKDDVILKKIRSSKKSGGFGLIHIRYFVQLNKGTLKVFNRPEGGATVRITLPVIEGYDLHQILKLQMKNAFLTCHQQNFHFQPIEYYENQPLLIDECLRDDIETHLTTLIDFSIRAMKKLPENKNQRLRLETERLHNSATILISNTGESFPGEDNKKHIKMETFMRTPAGQDSGFIKASEYFVMIGGSLRVYNDRMQGATIFLTIPLLKES